MAETSENPIDPSLESMKDFSKVVKSTASAIQKMRQDAIFTDGIFSKKIKVAIATIWSISAKCEPCLKYYVVKAKEFGMTEEELGELLSVGSAMGGCVGEMWCLKAFHAFRNADKIKEGCCNIH